MRISVKQNDPGYRGDAYFYRAYLNGKEVKDCFTADEEKGEVHVYLRNAEGQLELQEDGEAIRSMVLHGVVRVERCDE